MTRFSANAMRQTTNGMNRRKYRRTVISMYRGIVKEVRWYAKRGYGHVDFNRFHIKGDFDKFHAFRLFAYKHHDFKIKWEIEYEWWTGKEEVKAPNCPYDEGIDWVTITVIW